MKVKENRLLKLLKSSELIGGKALNPKSEEDSEYFGPLHMVTYASERNLKVTSIKKIINIRKSNSINPSEYTITELTKGEAEKLCRCSFTALGFVSANMYTNKSDTNGIIVKVVTDFGTIKPLVFLREDSNVAIFCNKNNETSFVIDGRARVVNNKLYLLSSNEEAINKFIDIELKRDDNMRISLQRTMSSEFWQIQDQDSKEKKIKSLNILGYTKYMEFPEMEDGTPYNVVWNNAQETLYDVISGGVDLSNQIRYSSLSQNGESAFCGKILNKTNVGYNIGVPKQFKGVKGKLDVSATQGPKTFKASNNTVRCLICLAEVRQPKAKMSLNSMGNMLVTKQAYDTYATNLTKEKAKDNNCAYPSHKVFLKVNGETVRIKGATSYVDAVATLENGGKEDKIVVMPPREFSVSGDMEEDIEKFEYLCRYRDSESQLQMVKLEVNGKTINCPAIYCKVVEDPNHSAVYSLRIKAQNLFYYGMMYNLYHFNGKTGMKKILNGLIDSKLVANAMNFAGISKVNIEETDYVDFIDSL